MEGSASGRHHRNAAWFACRWRKRPGGHAWFRGWPLWHRFCTSCSCASHRLRITSLRQVRELAFGQWQANFAAAGTGKVQIGVIKPPDGLARDEAEATDLPAETNQRKSGRRHR